VWSKVHRLLVNIFFLLLSFFSLNAQVVAYFLLSIGARELPLSESEKSQKIQQKYYKKRLLKNIVLRFWQPVIK